MSGVGAQNPTFLPASAAAQDALLSLPIYIVQLWSIDMNQPAVIAQTARPSPRVRKSRQLETGGMWHDMVWRPGRRQRVRLLYRIEGPADAPVVLAAGGISADRRVDQWWADLYGEGRALDPNRQRILSIDWLGQRWPDDSVVTTAQQAQALLAVLDHLGIQRLPLFVGASYGAMVGLALAAICPERVGRLLAISGAHCPHPMAVARRMIQRDIIRLGVSAGEERLGITLARALALTTYRPASLFGERFQHAEPAGILHQLDGYFQAQGRRLVGRFDAERYLSLSESLDRHQVDPARVRCPVTLIGVRSDELVPVEQLQTLQQALPQAELRVIQSAYGHDAFLKEVDFFSQLLAGLVAAEVSA